MFSRARGGHKPWHRIAANMVTLHEKRYEISRADIGLNRPAAKTFAPVTSSSGNLDVLWAHHASEILAAIFVSNPQTLKGCPVPFR